MVQTEELEQEEEEQEEIDPDDVDAQIGYIQKQLNFIMELPQIIQDNLKFLQDQLQKLSTFRAGVNQENEPEPGNLYYIALIYFIFNLENSIDVSQVWPS